MLVGQRWIQELSTKSKLDVFFSNSQWLSPVNYYCHKKLHLRHDSFRGSYQGDVMVVHCSLMWIILKSFPGIRFLIKLAKWIVRGVILSSQLVWVTVTYIRNDNCRLHLICITLKYTGHSLYSHFKYKFRIVP